MSKVKIKKVYYRKLIRDNIPRKMRRVGADFSCKILNKRTFLKELLKKVGEEASGLLNAKNRKGLIEELADVVDVIEEIKRVKKISSADIKTIQKRNKKLKGGFRKRIFLIWSEDTGYKTNERKY
ncbi:MAG: nucleoside triphosphate pyrophosphohydrolase [Microgenomates group bacterium]